MRDVELARLGAAVILVGFVLYAVYKVWRGPRDGGR